jgi:hypothetical protein
MRGDIAVGFAVMSVRSFYFRVDSFAANLLGIYFACI